MNKPWLIGETNWKTVKETGYQIVVLPWGATEAHNYHLPFATDNLQNEYVADKAAEIAWNHQVKVAVLPNIPYGVNTGQTDLKLTISMNPSTQFMVLKDIAGTIYHQGFRKMVILNGHGGNDFRQMIRELQPLFPDLALFQVNWYLAVPWKDYFEDTGEHAGESETSAMMVIRPDLVAPVETAGEGKNKKLIFKGRQEGWLWAPRPWSIVTSDTGIGNPQQSNSQKGQQYLDDCIGKIADFFVELARVKEINEMYR
ncbi:MAG TPA: creatininase family protein [Bacteroidales bacterium]|nr:creatininase family protein [Bacteroidales bacterium]HQK36371.1 creatininase family protein [Bacteroidales bacterium]